MAHELDFSLGRAAIAIRWDGKTPWHGFGERIAEEELNDVEAWRVRGGCDYTVEERAVYYSKHVSDPLYPTRSTTEFKNVPTPISSRKVLVRSDTQADLGVVSTGYEVVQPHEITDFLKQLIDEFGFSMHTLGALSGGKRIWALASTGPGITIMGQDKIDLYMLAATSYDTSMATILRPTSVHVVCSNTLAFAMMGGHQYISIPHSTKVDWDQLKKDIGLARDGEKIFEDQVNLLAEHTVDLDTAVAFFSEILGKEAVKIDADTGKAEYTSNMKKLFSCYEVGMGQDMRSTRHTAWGLVNAVTQFQDYEVKARDNGTRMNSAWFGPGAARKRHAFDLAKKVAGIVSEAA